MKRLTLMSFVTVVFTLAVIAGFFLGRIPSDAFFPVAANVIAYWFAGQRAPTPPVEPPTQPKP